MNFWMVVGKRVDMCGCLDGCGCVDSCGYLLWLWMCIHVGFLDGCGYDWIFGLWMRVWICGFLDGCGFLNKHVDTCVFFDCG